MKEKENYKLDKGTFGNTKASHLLVKLMNEQKVSREITHRILKLIQNAQSTFAGIDTIPDRDMRNKVLQIALKHFLRAVNEEIGVFIVPAICSMYPEVECAITCTKNVVTASYRKVLHKKPVTNEPSA